MRRLAPAWGLKRETMPLYEYECKQCGRHTEKIQKFSDVEITDCPHCGGTLERVPSAPAISFKGRGWFADGYGNAKPSSSANDSKGDSAKSNGTSSDSGSPKSESSAAPSSTPAAGAAPAASPPSSSSSSSSSAEKK
jgi:putative FmdB family regulatory protein